MNSTQIQVTRNMRGELQAETDIELHKIDATHTRIARITTMKGTRGVRCWVQVGIHEAARAGGFQGFSYAMGFGGPGGDYSATLASEANRCTMAAIARVHAAGLAAWIGIEAAVRAKYPAPELATA